MLGKENFEIKSSHTFCTVETIYIAQTKVVISLMTELEFELMLFEITYSHPHPKRCKVSLYDQSQLSLGCYIQPQSRSHESLYRLG